MGRPNWEAQGPAPELQSWLASDDHSDLLSKDDVHLPRHLFICEMNEMISQMAYLSWQEEKIQHSTIQIRELGIEPTLCLLFKEISHMPAHYCPWWDVLYASCFRHVGLCATPWTVAHQAPLFMGFFRQESWSGLPCPTPGDLPNPGIKSRSPTLQAGSLPPEPPGKPPLVR